MWTKSERWHKELPLMYSKFKSNLKINVFRMRFITCSRCIWLLFAMCVSIWIHIKQTAATLDNNVIFLKITHQQFDFFLTSDKTHLLVIGSLWPYISLITKVASWKDVHYLIFTTVIHVYKFTLVGFKIKVIMVNLLATSTGQSNFFQNICLLVNTV